MQAVPRVGDGFGLAHWQHNGDSVAEERDFHRRLPGSSHEGFGHPSSQHHKTLLSPSPSYAELLHHLERPHGLWQC